MLKIWDSVFETPNLNLYIFKLIFNLVNKPQSPLLQVLEPKVPNPSHHQSKTRTLNPDLYMVHKPQTLLLQLLNPKMSYPSHQ